jgi:hypothetical protein
MAGTAPVIYGSVRVEPLRAAHVQLSIHDGSRSYATLEAFWKNEKHRAIVHNAGKPSDKPQ